MVIPDHQVEEVLEDARNIKVEDDRYSQEIARKQLRNRKGWGEPQGARTIAE